jgi:hypothetical protein
MDLATLAVTGLVTLIGSGFGTAVVNYWLAERKAKRDLRRTKLEELFLAFAGWEKIVSGDSIVFYRLMCGKIDYTQALDIVNNDREGKEPTFDTVEMLISLYFHELNSAFQRVLKSLDHLNEIRQMHKRAYERGENDPQFAKEFSGELRKFGDAEKALKGDIAQLAADVTKWK